MDVFRVVLAAWEVVGEVEVGREVGEGLKETSFGKGIER